MKALVYTAPGEFRIADLPRPKPKDDEVLIRVAACGICKTDLHIHRGEFLARFPLTPGHEFAGKIAEMGAAVRGFEVGDPMVADNTILCGHCYWCRRNHPLYCENFYSLGCTGPGGFAEYVVVKAEKVFPWTRLPLVQGTLAEPTACAVHGLDVIDVRPGDSILLFGSGPTGLILGQLLKHAGASTLVVAAPSRSKLELARHLCADDTVQVDKLDAKRHTEVLKAKYPRGFDIVVDATGVASVTQQAVEFASYGAKVVVYGVCREQDRILISPYEIFSKELRLLGSFAQTHCFGRAISFLEGGVVSVESLITRTFQLEQWAEAIETVGQGGEGCLKAVIGFDE